MYANKNQEILNKLESMREYIESHNDVELSKVVRSNPELINMVFKCGETPLIHSIAMSNTFAFDLLMKQENINLNAQSEIGTTPLIYSAWVGNLYCFQKLYESGANIRIVNDEKFDVLMAASISGVVPIMKIITNDSFSSFFLNKRTSKGHTAASFASFNLNAKALIHLLDFGFNPKQINKIDFILVKNEKIEKISLLSSIAYAFFQAGNKDKIEKDVVKMLAYLMNKINSTTDIAEYVNKDKALQKIMKADSYFKNIFSNVFDCFVVSKRIQDVVISKDSRKDKQIQIKDEFNVEDFTFER